jgi:hypothetical protein
MIDKAILQQWILANFNKEGIAMFSVLCLSFFMVASVFAKWAFDQGQFTNIEEAKFEMMEL